MTLFKSRPIDAVYVKDGRTKAAGTILGYKSGKVEFKSRAGNVWLIDKKFIRVF